MEQLSAILPQDLPKDSNVSRRVTTRVRKPWLLLAILTVPMLCTADDRQHERQPLQKPRPPRDLHLRQTNSYWNGCERVPPGPTRMRSPRLPHIQTYAPRIEGRAAEWRYGRHGLELIRSKVRCQCSASSAGDERSAGVDCGLGNTGHHLHHHALCSAQAAVSSRTNNNGSPAAQHPGA